MKQKSSEINFFGALSILISSVVGIGIFFKNKSVFEIAEFNSTTVVVSWLSIAFLCLLTALVYAKISGISQGRESGLNKWAEVIFNKEASFFIKKTLIFFYFGIIIPGFCFYAGELILMMIDGFLDTGVLLNDGLFTQSTMLLISISGLLILFGIIWFNYRHEETAIKAQKVFVVFKFLPIILISSVALWIYWKNSDGSLFSKNVGDTLNENGDQTSSKNVGSFSTLNLLNLFPGILFAFDSFLNIGYLSPRIKNAKKTLPKVFSVGIISASILYIVITFSFLLCGTGDFTSLLSVDKVNAAFGTAGESLSKILQFFMSLMIFVSAIGLVNSYSCTAWQVIKSMVKDDLFSFCKRIRIKSEGSVERAALKSWVSISSVWTVIFLIFFFGLNSDSIVDGLTNLPTLFFFFIYGAIPIGYIWYIKNLGELKGIKTYLFCLVSLLVGVCWCGVVCYQVLGIYLVNLFDFNGEFNLWSGFAKTVGVSFNKGFSSLVFFICLGVFFLIPWWDRRRKLYMDTGYSCLTLC